MIRARTLNLAEAKAHLSELVQRAARGEEIIIARNGEPQARLMPLAARVTRTPGRGAGKWKVSAHFNDPLPSALLAEIQGAGE